MHSEESRQETDCPSFDCALLPLVVRAVEVRILFDERYTKTDRIKIIFQPILRVSLKDDKLIE